MTSKVRVLPVLLQSSTYAAGAAVFSTAASVAPQLPGAIDIMVIEQPDGSLKSSPFYGELDSLQTMRLPKWTLLSVVVVLVLLSAVVHWDASSYHCANTLVSCSSPRQTEAARL